MREERAVRLLHALMERGYDINVFGTREKLVELAVDRFAYYSGFLSSDEIDDNRKNIGSGLSGPDKGVTSDNLAVSQMQYLSRKLRYNISQETIFSKISAYVDSGFEDTFVLAGDSGCGKSMALEKYTVKQVFVLDGMEYLEEAAEAGWLITGMNPTVKIIISLGSDYCQYLPKDHVILEKMAALPVQSLIEHIYRKEGKQLEYPFIQKTLDDICRNWSLRQTAEGLQQFLRIILIKTWSIKAFHFWRLLRED